MLSEIPDRAPAPGLEASRLPPHCVVRAVLGLSENEVDETAREAVGENMQVDDGGADAAVVIADRDAHDVRAGAVVAMPQQKALVVQVEGLGARAVAVIDGGGPGIGAGVVERAKPHKL